MDFIGNVGNVVGEFDGVYENFICRVIMFVDFVVLVIVDVDVFVINIFEIEINY